MEDLLEQEKREQEKQNMSPGSNLSTALPPLSDADFERLRADVLNSSGMNGTAQPLLSPQGRLSFSTLCIDVLPNGQNYEFNSQDKAYNKP